MPRIPLWRAAFFLSGAAMMMGGPRHPSPHLDRSFHDSTALMLANPEWVPSHLFILFSFVFLLLGLALWQRQAVLPDRARRWSRFALAASGLAVVEMALHTAAVLDLDRLRAGAATPILSAHLFLTAVVYPLMALALAAVALHGVRAGRLGSRWIAWMAVLGGAAWGVAGACVVLTHDQRVSPLFAVGSSLIAFWFLLVAVWPIRSPVRVSGEAPQPLGA
jgi:nitrate reductase NapE component